MKYTEEEIIKHLQSGSHSADREQGAVMMLEQYAGLLWSVCQRRLQNPEDIKECVNSTFAEVCLHPECYDVEKGSLKNYLCMVADRNAIDCYHRNVRRQQTEENYCKEQEQIENLSTGMLYGGSNRFIIGNERAAEKLEEALEQLDPIDSQILRMKYYDGMTYQEIARQLGLTEGTVKMRSLRSRKKLFKMLIIVLILALLAACAVAVLRKYQFSERGGFIWGEENSMYRLVDGKVSWGDEVVQYELIDAIWLRREAGSLEGDVHVIFTEDWFVEQPTYDHLGVIEAVMSIKDQKLSDLGLINNVGHGEQAQTFHWTHYEDGILEYTINLNWVLEEKDPDQISIPIYVDRQWLTDIVLEPVDIKEHEDSKVGLQLENGARWSLGPALVGEVHTTVSLYGPHDEALHPVSRIYSSRYVSSPEGYSPTLVGKDGTVYGMMRAGNNTIHRSWIGEITQFDLSFPVVEPGEYELHIPAVCYEANWTSQEFTVTLPQEVNEFIECDITSLFPDGSGLHFTGITKTVKENIQYNVDPGEEVPREKKWYTWEYILDYELLQGDKMEFCLAILQSPENENFLGGIFPKSGQITFCTNWEYDPKEITLYLEHPEYIVHHDFVIPVIVERVQENIPESISKSASETADIPVGTEITNEK